MKHIISLAIFLLLIPLCSRAQIGGDYDPANPSDPGTPIQKYTLTLKANPSDGGSFNSNVTKVAVGEQYNLRAYPNSDFSFVAWICEGDTLSKHASYTYTMPSHNVEITGVFVYNPTNPADPEEQALKYQLSLKADPINSGSFNLSNERVAVGSTTSLRAYASTDYVFKQWMIGDSILSTDSEMRFEMPAHNVNITGKFEYNPANPANPNANYWNPLTGEVIVDDFTPGRLSDAVYYVISGSSNDEVSMITVAGKINDNDFGIANNYRNCTLLDLSRVTGVTEVPSYAFDYTNLESIYLPATIEKIGYRAFAECPSLSSLTIYAMIPPALEGNVFQGVPEGLVVYVPAATIAQYQDTDGWKDLILLPIQEDIRSITVRLPDGADPVPFCGLWLELSNTKNGQRIHFVITDRMEYVFPNIVKNTTWNVTLRNERGDVFGRIDNIEIKDEDVSVIFTTLSKPQNVSLAIVTPEGLDVTDRTRITWTDDQGNYVAQGATLTGLPVGFQTIYNVSLPQELAMEFDTPQPVEYILKDGDNNIEYPLVAISQVTISGKVKDASTGLPLNGATVSASQTFGGKYSKTLSTKTDKKGEYSLSIANVPTSVAFAAADYISNTIVCDSLMSGEANVTIPDAALKEITGATISLALTYTNVSEEVQNWYSDYQNVNFEIFNVTKNCPVSQYNVQYPRIVLLEDTDDSDVLRITASSRTNSFMPVEGLVVIDGQKGEATFNILELGQIHASFDKNENASVAGSLYDAAGKLLKTYNYTNTSLTITDLPDGQYTLVSMGGSRMFNSIYDLTQLPQTSLTEGSDYVLSHVDVKSGSISKLKIDEVPTLDESKLYYTGDNTSFTVNKPSIVAGNYLTLTGRIDFKPSYAGNVSNVQLIVDLPESCKFVDNSVMVGNNTGSYTLNGNRITIPLTYYTDRVRFCIIPTLSGKYSPSAFAQFDLDGKTVTQPIGSAYYTAENLSISVPSTVAKTTIPVSGTAIGKSEIEIYDNNVLIGQTTSLANGSWSTTCELNEPYNLSVHDIHAIISTNNGLNIQSESKEVIYDKNAVQIMKVTMYHYNPEMNTMYESVFDFQNPHTTSNKWTVYYPDKKFTYLVDFTNNSPEKVSNVVLYLHVANGKVVPVYPVYDEIKDIWVAEVDMGKSNDGFYPVNVSVDYDVISDIVLDAELFGNHFNTSANSQAILKEDISNFEDIYAQWENALNNNDTESSTQLLDELIASVGYSDTDTSLPRLDDASIQALLEEIKLYEDSLANTVENVLIANLYESDVIQQYMEGVSISKADGFSEDQLLAAGYDKVAKTDGTYYYILVDENGWNFVDLDANLYIVANEQSITQKFFILREEGQDWASSIKNLGDKLNTVVSAFQGIFDGVLERLVSLNSKEGKLLEEAQKRYATRYLDGLSSSEIKEIEKNIAKHAKAIKRNDGIIKWLEENVKQYMSGTTTTSKVAGKCFSIFALCMDVYDGIQHVSQMTYLRDLIETPCDEARPAAEKLRSDVNGWVNITGGYYVAKITSDIAEVCGISGGIAGLIPSGGTSTSAIVAAIAVIAANIAADIIFNNRYENAYTNFEKRYSELYKLCGKEPCDGQTPCPPPYPGDDGGGAGNGGGNGNGGGSGSGSSNDDVSVDPSGFVYEGVFSNRLEGVTATCFYKEEVEDMYGDIHENVVKWDAEEYAQENPLFTDENGYYRWDVPQGLWQVKFEKDGYETTHSEWLPVPPPQLEVNIPMKQNRQPMVKSARAYENAVEVEFDKYMMPELLTADNIFVMQNGMSVEGTVELLNEETATEGSTEHFASKVRFNAHKPFESDEVTLWVNNRVKSYAGIRMQDDYQQTFAIEQEIRRIVCDSTLTVGYGEQESLIVTVLPASASKGKVLNVKTSSPMILSVDTEQVIIGDNGQAEVLVSGELPGTAALTFYIEGTDKTALSIVNVKQVVSNTVANPKASIASGSVVDKGTEITLSCATEGATIYYTLDGSCPCDITESRKIYDGTPIVINDNTTIKAMAVAEGMYDSDVVEFNYFVDGSGIADITSDESIEIYPLPVHEKLNVSASGKMIRRVVVSSINGMLVATSHKEKTEVTIDVSNIPGGIYIINITTDDGVFSRKIQKVK